MLLAPEEQRAKGLKRGWGAPGEGYEARYGASEADYVARPPNLQAYNIPQLEDELEGYGELRKQPGEKKTDLIIRLQPYKQQENVAAFEARGGAAAEAKCEEPLFWKRMINEKLSKSIMCVTELMDHAINVAEEAYKGTRREKDFLIFHDALSQWWEKDAQEYMKKRGFRDRQLRCYGDVNKGTDEKKNRYHLKLVGDSPELCRALDAHGFADLEYMRKLHCALTQFYPHTDPEWGPKRFGMGTPSEVDSTLERVWTVAPAPDRVKHDIFNLPMVLDAIIEAEGCVVPDEFLRSGRRAVPVNDGRGAQVQQQQSSSSSSRPRGFAAKGPIHADAKYGRSLMLKPESRPVWESMRAEIDAATAAEEAAAAAAREEEEEEEEELEEGWEDVGDDDGDEEMAG